VLLALTRQDVILPLVVGLDEAMILLLIASGLSLTFGVMRIVNMAHGGFVALGAFLVFSLTLWADNEPWALAPAIVAATIVAAAASAGLERTVFRRLYGMENMATLLVTFALLIGFQGMVVEIWGQTQKSVPLPSGISGSVGILGVQIPTYNLIIIGVTIVVLPLLALFLARTRTGRETRVVAMDRSMAALLGVNTRRVFVVSFVVGSALAGLAGGLIAPTVAIDNTLAGSYVILAFAVLLIGGLGNLGGAVIAAIVLGLIDSFTIAHLPGLAGYSVYIAMIATLIVRPQGFRGAAAEVHL
jgi:branched-subunit amino acid ABC-type transport system permease component